MEDQGAPVATVYSVAELGDLDRLPAPRFAPARVGIQLDAPSLEESRRREIERRLAGAMAACGCREGSIALMLYLGLVPLLAVLGPLTPRSALGWLALVGGLFAASLLGKALGLAIARLRYLRVVNELEGIFLEAPRRA